MNRRSFIRTTSLAAVAAGTGATALATVTSSHKAGNTLPFWKGFNLTDCFSPAPLTKLSTTADHLKWMRDWGFNFVRLPIAYPCYLDFDRSRNILPEEVMNISTSAVDTIDRLVQMAHDAGLHVSLNLHRAPGYCINAGFHEPYNLWKDTAAQQAFYFHWNLWARRYKNLSRDKISFDLVNEPAMRDDMNDQHSRSGPVPGQVYRSVAKAAAEAIRSENPNHLVIADGNNVGNTVISEITDLDIAQSCRGYFPGAISHYKAPWANKNPDALPEPKWPGQVGEKFLDKTMLQQYYQPWIDLVQQGIGVHCGECGCWNKTPHAVFLAWFTDVLGILSTHKIGFALWNFVGDFGVLNSKRADVAYEDWYGYQLDRKLLQLLQQY